MLEWRRARTLRSIATLVAIVLMWIVATVPSGFSVVHLAMFAGPGTVLAIGAAWTAHAFNTEEFTWDRALTAGVVGAVGFPPVVGFFIAWTATFNPDVMIVLLILSSWLALGAGILGASLRALATWRRQPRPHSRRRVPHMRMLE